MIVLVSAHLDDAVFSAFHALGENTVVVTVLAGLPPEGAVGWWDEEGGARDSRARVLERRAEDVRALALAGARGLHGDLLEGQHRGADPQVEEIADALRASLEGAETVYAPAGIYNSEHKRVRDAVLGVRGTVRLYADLPYALRADFGGAALPSELSADEWRVVDVELTPEAAALKRQAAGCYSSQLPQLHGYFGDFLADPAFYVERYWVGSVAE